jgi:Ser/Thr protein kinase RdoA (MazF antagonist)
VAVTGAVRRSTVTDLARDHFGIEVLDVTPLPGERHANFRVDAATGSYVLKAFAAGTPDAEVDLQCRALTHLAERQAPGAAPALVGDGPASASVDGERRLLQLLRWVPGRPWSVARPSSPAAVSRLGALVATVDAGLADFAHPAAGAQLDWNLVHAERGLRHLELVDAEKRPLVRRVLEQHAEAVAPRLLALPAQVIHNDGNGYNVIVDDAGQPVALIDFGDLATSPRACGLAVAAAYAVAELGVPALGPLVAGYQAVVPLSPAEVRLLLPLLRARLAVSICMAAGQHAADPSNDYLLSYQDAVWPALLACAVADDEITYAFIVAAGAASGSPAPRP